MDKESMQAAYNVFAEIWKAYCNCRKRDKLEQSDCDQCAEKMLAILDQSCKTEHKQIAMDLVDTLFKNCRKDQVKECEVRI